MHCPRKTIEGEDTHAPVGLGVLAVILGMLSMMERKMMNGRSFALPSCSRVTQAPDPPALLGEADDLAEYSSWRDASGSLAELPPAAQPRRRSAFELTPPAGMGSVGRHPQSPCANAPRPGPARPRTRTGGKARHPRQGGLDPPCRCAYRKPCETPHGVWLVGDKAICAPPPSGGS